MQRQKQKKQKNQKSQQVRFHTLVFHVNPDLESTMIAWLLLTFTELARRLGVVDDPEIKFISAGPLRQEDWPGESDLDVDRLTAKGYMFLDCAGGQYDHHRKWPTKTDNERSSLDIITSLSGANVVLAHMRPVIDLVSANDLRGEQIVSDAGYVDSDTPHTARHLRNVIRGWNMIHAGNSRAVLDLANLAYCGIACLAERGQVSGEVFLADSICQGVADFCGQLRQDGDMTEEEAADTVSAFENAVTQALRALEQDWLAAEQDYWSATTEVHNLKRRVYFLDQKTGEQKSALKPLTVVVGVSDCDRFAEVTRRGNCGQSRPFPEQSYRKKADVTIHVREDGRFVIVSRHLDLGPLAAAIRREDLKRKGVDLRLVDPESLAQVGHLAFTSRSGEDVQALLLAYDKCFGNAFRANPQGIECTLTPDEIVRLTISALTAD